MKHAYLITLFLLCTAHLLFTQPVFRGAPVTPPASETFSRHFTDYGLFQVDAPTLNRYAKSNSGDFELNLQLGDAYHWVLALQPNDVRGENYKLVAATPEGKQEQPRTENKTFKGKVLSPLGEETRLTLDEHFIYGFVETGGETYYIEPAWPFEPGLGEDTYLVYPASAVINTGSYRCDWEGDPSPDVHELPAPEAGRVILACYQVDIALAADFLMVQRFGSVNGAESFMLGVLNNVQSNYDDEFNHQILFSVATLYVSSCSSCDPWTSSLSSGNLLDSFTDWGNSGGFGVNFDVASLWTDRDFFGNAIGVAWVGSVCTDGRYNILQNFSTNSALLRVLQAHELGHNFDASHDGQGTNFIMAPSVNNSNAWSNFSRSRINSFINAVASVPGCLSICGSVDPPVAALTSSATSGCVPLTVDFSDLSTGQVNNISWQFPGGSPSSSSSSFPTVTYNAAGTYDVILTVSNSSGANTIVLEDYIVASPAAAPQFSYSVNGLTVSFNNTSANAQTYQWAFGDGDFNNVLSPVHTYATDGLYLVSLTASNACGPVTVEEFVIVELPMQAGFSGNSLLGCPGASISFADLSTGTPVEWNWSFEGGMPAVSNSPSPSIAYENPGVYDVSLTVTNALGTSSTYSRQNYIAILPAPEAIFTYQYAPGGLTVQFANASTGADDWLWEFGDGATSSQGNPAHTYSADGNYTVTLTTTSQCGQDAMTRNIEVVTPPIAGFSADVLAGCAPLTAQMANESSPNAATFQWFFPGGTPGTSTLPDPVVDFNAPGAYQVTLISTNAAGSDTTTLTVSIDGGPQSEFAIEYTPGDTEASFENQSSNADSLLWIFENGATSTAESPSYNFSSDGIFPVTLIAFNACDNDTLTQQVEVVTAPAASFELDAAAGCTPFTTQASDLSSSNTTDWAWSAPGATPETSTEQNPSFTFAAPGSYTITLEA
ncbi:MAG: PKD domain-containing protein, partial [Phaeodactylibacter sp.]|nr:PKD domain-containing protein [Phaeodactylibacter sp.]